MATTHLKQPSANTCGQTCLAMLLGVTVEEAIKAVGTSGPTSRYAILRGADKLGRHMTADLVLGYPASMVRIPPSEWKARRYLPQGHGILRFTAPGWRGHWVAYSSGVIHDPLEEEVNRLQCYGMDGLRVALGIRLHPLKRPPKGEP